MRHGDAPLFGVGEFFGQDTFRIWCVDHPGRDPDAVDCVDRCAVGPRPGGSGRRVEPVLVVAMQLGVLVDHDAQPAQWDAHGRGEHVEELACLRQEFSRWRVDAVDGGDVQVELESSDPPA